MNAPQPILFDHADAELTCWRDVGPRALRAVERLLASQGDHAERDLITLQHDLAELCGPTPDAARSHP